jgi:competence protein ComEC
MLGGRWGRTASPVRGLGDGAVGAAALATAAGAWVALPMPWPAAAIAASVVGFVALRRGHTVPLVAGCFVLSCALAARAWAGAAPVPAGPFSGVVTLRTDPSPLGAGVVADVVAGRQHLELRAFGGSARRLRARLAGEQLAVEGRIVPPSRAVAGWLRSRHIVAVLQPTRLELVGDGTTLAHSANRLRQLLERGARTIDPVDRSLYLGFVIGDDRGQPPATVEAFRSSGLAHLSAVSGENVALLLAAASPVLRRARAPTRWAATLGLIGWFALLTRFEPSVLRASVMAALAATALVAGRPSRPVRILGLTVTIVLLADPLLVHSVGWWLSVGATAGIVALAGPLAARLPGPAPVRLPLAVTMAAQLGVAPVSIGVFGPLPLASVPANLLAVPAAAPIMLYGLPAGLLAGVCPDPVARLLQLPTVLLVRFVARVASSAAGWPLPHVGWPGLVGAVGVTVVVLRRAPRHRR